MTRACCAPARHADRPRAASPDVMPGRPREGHRLVELPGGSFRMGCGDPPYPTDGEAPVRTVTVDGFAIAATTVSNAQFAEFVAATGYRTDAERFGWSFVFAGLLAPDFPPTRAAAAAPWWRQVHGADWRHPEGPASSLDGRHDHPAVHVSWNDASAYCAWAQVRLATESEWELAARGGLDQQPYPWGDSLVPDGVHRMNVWQGAFPTHDTGEDGYRGTAPVDAFAPNAFGLFNMTGNVWEWCADWFSARDAKALRGGSYLCHASYCRRYRTSARMGNTPDSSAGNIGFRVAAPPSPAMGQP